MEVFVTVAKSFALISESEGQPSEVDLVIKMSPSLLVLAATLLVFAQTPRTGTERDACIHGMAVFGEEEGVQMNSAIDQNLIRYTTACPTGRRASQTNQ